MLTSKILVLADGGDETAKMIADGLPFTSAGPPPPDWRLLKVGDNELTQKGKKYRLALTAEDIQKIAAYNADKGEKIPVDSRHAIMLAAEAAGVTENEILKLIPQGTLALGYSALEARDDGLYAKDVEWLPIAKKMVDDGFFRYFSPVIRDYGTDAMRVTSIALDNVPALNKLDVLAASDNVEKIINLKKEKPQMELIIAALGKLFPGMTLALGAEQDQQKPMADKIIALAAELPDLRTKAAAHDALALSAEKDKVASLITDAIAKNKITNATAEKLRQMGSVALADVLESMPEGVVPNEKIPPTGEGTADPVLTEDEKKIAASLGVSEADYIKAKKGC